MASPRRGPGERARGRGPGGEGPGERSRGRGTGGVASWGHCSRVVQRLSAANLRRVIFVSTGSYIPGSSSLYSRCCLPGCGRPAASNSVSFARSRSSVSCRAGSYASRGGCSGCCPVSSSTRCPSSQRTRFCSAALRANAGKVQGRRDRAAQPGGDLGSCSPGIRLDDRSRMRSGVFQSGQAAAATCAASSGHRADTASSSSAASGWKCIPGRRRCSPRRRTGARTRSPPRPGGPAGSAGAVARPGTSSQRCWRHPGMPVSPGVEPICEVRRVLASDATRPSSAPIMYIMLSKVGGPHAPAACRPRLHRGCDTVSDKRHRWTGRSG